MVLCEVALPKGEVALPKGEVALPKGVVALPKGEVALPKGVVALPKGIVALPKGVVALQQGANKTIRCCVTEKLRLFRSFYFVRVLPCIENICNFDPVIIYVEPINTFVIFINQIQELLFPFGQEFFPLT